MGTFVSHIPRATGAWRSKNALMNNVLISSQTVRTWYKAGSLYIVDVQQHLKARIHLKNADKHAKRIDLFVLKLRTPRCKNYRDRLHSFCAGESNITALWTQRYSRCQYDTTQRILRTLDCYLLAYEKLLSRVCGALYLHRHVIQIKYIRKSYFGKVNFPKCVGVSEP